MKGVKHLVECQCILPQSRKMKNPPLHKFVVFSMIDDESDTTVSKFAQCDNCGIIHEVYDICKSNIMHGKEDSRSIVSIDDIKLFMNPNISSVLENYNCDLATWEHAQFIMSHKKWGEFICLTREETGGVATGKILRFDSDNNFKIEPYESNVSF